MTTVLLWFLIVCLALLWLGFALACGAWSIALVQLGPSAPAVIVLAATGAALMAWSLRGRITVPAARVVVRRRLEKGASL